MSKLVTRIEKLSRGSPTPMGFGASSRAAQTPAMALIGILTKRSLKAAERLAKLDADGALIFDASSVNGLNLIIEALGETPWGIKTTGLDAEGSDALVEKGCDFFIADADSVTVEAAKDERADVILSLPEDPADGFLRALEDLPISAVYTSLNEGDRLTLQRLIDVGAVRTMLDKYLIVEIPATLSSRELEALRDMGVDAVAVKAAGATKSSLKSLKQRLVELPRQRKSRQERSSAVLPAGLRASNAHSDHDNE